MRRVCRWRIKLSGLEVLSRDARLPKRIEALWRRWIIRSVVSLVSLVRERKGVDCCPSSIHLRSDVVHIPSNHVGRLVARANDQNYKGGDVDYLSKY